MTYAVQRRERTGRDWSKPKFFPSYDLAKVYFQVVLTKLRPEGEAHLIMVRP